MKLFNRVSPRIRSRSRKRPPIRLSFDLFEERLLLVAFTVDSFFDTNTGTGNNGTLRFVINQLNASTEPNNTIKFAIGDLEFPSRQTIDLTADLPAVTKQVTINGYSQGGTPNTSAIDTNANILIQLNLNGHSGLLFSGG